MGSSTRVRLSRLRNQWKEAKTAMMNRERAMLRMACSAEVDHGIVRALG